MDRAEAIKRLKDLVKTWDGDPFVQESVDAFKMVITALREQETVTNGLTNDGCEYCNEDRYGYRKMLGAFSIYNPFHGYEYYLNCGKVKPRKINYCPMCGRKLGGDEG